MRVRTALEQLPLGFREVIVLREIEGLTYKEIAAVIGAPIGTLMSRLAPGREPLLALLRAVASVDNRAAFSAAGAMDILGYPTIWGKRCRTLTRAASRPCLSPSQQRHPRSKVRRRSRR